MVLDQVSQLQRMHRGMTQMRNPRVIASSSTARTNVQVQKVKQSIRRTDRKGVDVFANVPLRVVRARADRGEIYAQSELARRLSRRNKNEEALQWFRKAARSNDPERQMELGIVLCWEHAAYREGFKWIRRAAEQGHVGAQYFLGSELATGENIRQNLHEAARWYRRAAMKNHSEAQYNLALMYWAGEGVPSSRAASHKWLEKAANLNDLLALRTIAEAYEDGCLGYKRNRVRARFWRKRYNARKRSPG